MAKNISERYGTVDAIRAIAVINMVIFHFLYDYFYFVGNVLVFVVHPAVMIWERIICITFIVISGASLNFTRNGYKRGLIVLLCGFLVTAVTLIFIPDQTIWFGALSLIGVAMLLTYALRGLLKRLNPWLGAAVFSALFILSFHIPDGYIGLFSLRLFDLPKALYMHDPLAFLGFPPNDFVSADYFPILPWIFLFIFGYLLWRAVESVKKDVYLRRNVPFLSFVGRHSLIIYLVHQPILYFICYLMFQK